MQINQCTHAHRVCQANRFETFCWPFSRHTTARLRLPCVRIFTIFFHLQFTQMMNSSSKWCLNDRDGWQHFDGPCQLLAKEWKLTIKSGPRRFCSVGSVTWSQDHLYHGNGSSLLQNNNKNDNNNNRLDKIWFTPWNDRSPYNGHSNI